MAHLSQSTKLALVIDDNECVRTLLRIALKCEGWRVAEAGSGDEAAEKAAQLRPDLILTDLEMPAGGFQNIRRLRALCQASPILVLSGLEARSVEAESLKNGGNLFFEKPFHLADLREAIDKLVEAPPSYHRPNSADSVFVDSL